MHRRMNYTAEVVRNIPFLFWPPLQDWDHRDYAAHHLTDPSKVLFPRSFACRTIRLFLANGEIAVCLQRSCTLLLWILLQHIYRYRELLFRRYADMVIAGHVFNLSVDSSHGFVKPEFLNERYGS
jgi:hypothetical protein